MDEYTDLLLNRGTTGLGFNIRGGVDQPHLPNDKGIFVTKIRDNGSAAADGTLQEGDKIIEINGNPMEGLTHNQAVNLFLCSGDEVRLKIWSGAEKILLEKMKAKEPSNKDNTKNMILYGVIGIVICGIVWYFKDDLTDFLKSFTNTSRV